MMIYDETWLRVAVASRMRATAAAGTFDGRIPSAYLDRCRALHRPTGTLLLFSRDVGMHASGWLKNPDYDRCYHLSTSFVDPATGRRRPRDRALSRDWVALFFGESARYLWAEPPFTPGGKVAEVWHYRLFTDPGWNPILPRGEVYSRAFTERGWLSYSDLRAAEAEAEARLLERAADPARPRKSGKIS
jgi:hypothetical protein